MKLSTTLRSHLIYIVAMLHIVLFTYAALSKVRDFHTFQVQLGQSPLLSAFAEPVSYIVPTAELLISLMLLLPRFRYLGLYASFIMMMVFTAYIFIMLHFSPFTPCSCGGILDNMGWNEHLIFNIAFSIIGAFGLLLHKRTLAYKIRVAALGLITFLSFCLVTTLFLFSEETIHYNNNFIRRFPKHPTSSKKTIELSYSSYYLAGYDSKHIYLGNRTAPLLVTIFDLTLTKKREVRIKLPDLKLSFRAPRMYVRTPYFYFSDGSVPCVFQGDTLDWNAKLKMFGKAYYTVFRPINKDSAVIRAISSKTKENALGVLSFNSGIRVKLNNNLLQKQIDGIFDTDGILLYNSQIGKIIYTYYYRNQFIITDSRFRSTTIGKTIDSVSHAQIQVASINSNNTTTLSKQPLTVNKLTATYGNYLFVNSALMGRFEPKIMWTRASIIDVYDLKENAYSFSFYIYDKQGRKTDEFVVVNDKVISLNGKFLTVEEFKTDYYTPWNTVR